MNSFFISDVRLIDAKSNRDEVVDVLVQNGILTSIEKPGKKAVPSGIQKIDGKGKWLTSGFIDAQTFIGEPGFEFNETIESASRTAVKSGFTSITSLPSTLPVNDNPYVTSYVVERAKKTALCRIIPLGSVSKGLQGEELSEIGSMVEAGVRALTDGKKTGENTYLMRKALNYTLAFGVPIFSWPQDMSLTGQGVMNEGALSNELGLRGSPSAAEEIRVAREISLVRLTGGKVHLCSLSSELSLPHLERAKRENLNITASVTPQHLALTEESIRKYDSDFKVIPPFRREKDRQALLKAVNDGLIDLFATDHEPVGLVDKALEFDTAKPGMIALETALSLTLAHVKSGELSAMRWVNAWTVAPAELLGLDFQGLKTGEIADLILIDPDASYRLTDDEIPSKSKNTPFRNETLFGRVVLTAVGGKIVHESKGES